MNRNAIKDGRKKDVGKVEEHFQAERNKESNKISYDRTIQDMTRIRYRSSNIGKDFLIAEEKLSSTYRKLFRSESIPCFNCSKMYRFTMLSSRFPITSSVKWETYTFIELSKIEYERKISSKRSQMHTISARNRVTYPLRFLLQNFKIPRATM